MLFHELSYSGNFNRAEAIIGRQRDRLKPEFGFQIVASHMDMRRLIAFAAVKMKPIWTNFQDGRRGSM
jgi:hypothetical protein